MPLILLFCVVGTFAINNSMFEVGVMLVAGILAYILEANRFPIAPAILGVVLGGMLEENFITSMIKANGDLSAFFARPIALSLAVLSILVWTWPLIAKLWSKPSPSQMA
jgi:TctA family transporter